MTSNSRISNLLLLVATALLFSTGGAAIKATAVSSWQLAGWRCGVAALAVFLFVPSARRGWNWRVWPVGVAYAAASVSFVASTKLTTAANAIFLQNSAPLYVLLLSVWLLRERIRAHDLVFIAAMAGGIVMFFLGTGAPLATAPDPLRGNLWGVFSGLAWGGTIAGLRWLGKRAPLESQGAMTVIAGNLIACLACLPAALPLGPVSASDLLLIFYLGVFQIGLAYICLTRAIRHIPAFEASTVLLLEPVLNPVWAWLIQGEQPGSWSLAGGAIVVAAIFGNAWWHSRRGAPAQPAVGAGQAA